MPLSVASKAQWQGVRESLAQVEAVLLSASCRRVCRIWLHFVHFPRGGKGGDASRAETALRGFCARRMQAASGGKATKWGYAQRSQSGVGQLREALAA